MHAADLVPGWVKRILHNASVIDHGSRLELERARLLSHLASHVIGTQGNKAAEDPVAKAKVAVPRTATSVTHARTIARSEMRRTSALPLSTESTA